MDILFKREQTAGSVGRVHFKLWCKIDLNEEEQALLDHYSLDNALLIEADEQKLFRQAGLLGLGVFLVTFVILFFIGSLDTAVLLGGMFGIGSAVWFFNEKRETILVRDVLHGRHFKCKSVIGLAKKENHLRAVISQLSAVIASAKHWDGEERTQVETPTRTEAKQILASL
ncbi:MAG: hypothetical protein ABJN35_14140 [Erythrobacter sp.]